MYGHVRWAVRRSSSSSSSMFTNDKWRTVVFGDQEWNQVRDKATGLRGSSGFKPRGHRAAAAAAYSCCRMNACHLGGGAGASVQQKLRAGNRTPVMLHTFSG